MLVAEAGPTHRLVWIAGQHLCNKLPLQLSSLPHACCKVRLLLLQVPV